MLMLFTSTTSLATDQTANRIQTMSFLPSYRSPNYLSELVTSAADVSGRATLCSTNHGDLVMPRTRLSPLRRAFSVVVHARGIDCPLILRQSSTFNTVTFKRKLKTYFNQAYDL